MPFSQKNRLPQKGKRSRGARRTGFRQLREVSFDAASRISEMLSWMRAETIS